MKIGRVGVNPLNFIQQTFQLKRLFLEVCYSVCMVQNDLWVNLYGHQEWDAVPVVLNLKIVLMVREPRNQ